ncbi:hypothetical protein DSCO28_70760 [Desulfosarcina ovata subsp. sediminis]|uniref:Lipoprotein n=1 Tax=Desulfosarcina ovata subsp. sediminis TaxID=885957 RepID=A0A5K8A2K5_9BACT|nr:tetratricopeptide repeat protein [Desulfosarcina ovata]BBO86510.1 hypothetical protein DSCO28_70760 [Desulfosarcina ovata subsp. sediminis]
MGRSASLMPLVVACWVVSAVFLGGCAGHSDRETPALRPPETQARPDWRPGEAEPDYLALARDLIHQGHYTVALRQLELAAQADRSIPEPHYLMGVCHRKTGDAAVARACFLRAIRLDGGYAPAYNGLGIVCFMDRQYGPARKAMLKAITLNPANPDFFNDLGVVEMRSHLADSALARFEECLHIDSGHTRAKNNLAECLVRLGRNRTALAFLETHFPAAVACNNMGVIYEQVGYVSRARGMFQQALDLDPGLAVARRNLNRMESKEDH